MLFDRTFHYAFLAGSFINSRKELGLFIVMVLRNAVVPSETIANKITAVAGLYSWSLLIDAIKTTDERVVAQGHVGGFKGERVRLVEFLSSS